MDLTQAVVLVTGATSGIGLALAERFMSAGSKVIVCGRRKEKLDQIKADHPECETIVADVATAEQRKRLFEESTKSFPKLNVVVKNAGIQRKLQLTEAEPWEQTHSELAINLEAPIHLTQLFIPHLLKQTNPVIINTTSCKGLPFVEVDIRAPSCCRRIRYDICTIAPMSVYVHLEHQAIQIM